MAGKACFRSAAPHRGGCAHCAVASRLQDLRVAAKLDPQNQFICARLRDLEAQYGSST